ncbi:Transposable element Tc1 transposase [Araneus ventricosus]|uniref:Transposable element Tc1 transposase n=1 Tax=Araneus ventricosus TaxID=182803 RepID=A0A4Y2FHG9_ARAVE|nr:Transposable element Tc1 transposase [Araneus ventricosus]
MGKAADLSKFDRGLNVLARRLGTSITEAARLVGCSRSAVVSIHAKWINDGDTSSRCQGVGRPRVIKGKGRRRLSRLWAREHRDWILDEWKRVANSDESRFLIHHVDGRVRLRRLPGEQLLPSCTAGHIQAGSGGTMLWRMFSWAALGPSVMVDKTMKAANYLNIIVDQLRPYMAFVFPNGNGIFQQDNAPCHKARIVLEWFEEHTDEFHLISWPPNSPDLNPM